MLLLLVSHPLFREVKVALVPIPNSPSPSPSGHLNDPFTKITAISKAKPSPGQLQDAGPTIWTQTCNSPYVQSRSQVSESHALFLLSPDPHPALSAQLSSLGAPRCSPGGWTVSSSLPNSCRICSPTVAKTLALLQEVLEWGCLEPVPRAPPGALSSVKAAAGSCQSPGLLRVEPGLPAQSSASQFPPKPPTYDPVCGKTSYGEKHSARTGPGVAGRAANDGGVKALPNHRGLPLVGNTGPPPPPWTPSSQL